MPNPYVSFLVPVYNTGKYLPKCLDSLLGQTEENIEIIVVNDGSTDNSAEILEIYRGRDTRIKVITHPRNCGLLEARITAIKFSSGRYIAHVDSDDWTEPDFAAKIVEYSDNFTYDIIAFQFSLDFLSLRKKLLKLFELRDGRKNYVAQSCILKNSAAIFEKYLAHEITWESCGKAIKSSLAKSFCHSLPTGVAAGIIFSEDAIQTTFHVCHARSYRCVPDKSYHYRCGIGVTTIDFSDFDTFRTRLKNHASALELIRLFINETYPPFEDYQNRQFHLVFAENLQKCLLNSISCLPYENRCEGYSLFMECYGQKRFLSLLGEGVCYIPEELPISHFLKYSVQYAKLFLKRNAARLKR